MKRRESTFGTSRMWQARVGDGRVARLEIAYGGPWGLSQETRLGFIFSCSEKGKLESFAVAGNHNHNCI